MYIKRILLGIALVGLIGGGIFAYLVFGTFFTPNTNFNNDEAIVFIPSNASVSDLEERLAPLLEDFGSFKSAAERKGYIG